MEKIIEIAKGNGGFITTAQSEDAGIPRARLSDMVKGGQLERVQRGVYCLADSWEDEFVAAQLRFPKGIFSDGTALFLHDFTDQTPFQLTMTFARSYRATSARRAGIIVRTCSDDVLDLGIVAIETPYGNEVKAYDLERTLCDLVRGERTVDVQIVNPAMKRYAREKRAGVGKLLDYADALGVLGKVRNYMEVLL